MVSVTGPDSSWCLRVGDPQSSLRSASTPFIRPTKVPVRLCSRLGQQSLLRLSACLIASYPRQRSNCRLRPFVVPTWRVWEELWESQRSSSQSEPARRGYQESIALSRGCEGIANRSRRRSECVNRQWSGSGCPAIPQRATTVDIRAAQIPRGEAETVSQLATGEDAVGDCSSSSSRGFLATRIRGPRRRNREVARSRYGATHRSCVEQRGGGGRAGENKTCCWVRVSDQYPRPRRSLRYLETPKVLFLSARILRFWGRQDQQVAPARSGLADEARDTNARLEPIAGNIYILLFLRLHFFSNCELPPLLDNMLASSTTRLWRQVKVRLISLHPSYTTPPSDDISKILLFPTVLDHAEVYAVRSSIRRRVA